MGQTGLRRTIRTLVLSLGSAAAGAALLVAAANGASSASGAGGAVQVKRGGTLRVDLSTNDFAYLDPALSYDDASWTVLYSTSLLLLNYFDAPAPRGNRLVPEAAEALPRISRDGRTYTFTIRRGLRFSDGSPLTAAAFKRAFERAAHPDMVAPAASFLHNVAGADARIAGSARSVSGVTARGRTLTIRLTRPDPTLLAQLAMQFFAAVKPSLPIDPKGVSVYPSGGPYFISSRELQRGVVLERNRFYRGSRPRNPDRIVITVLTDEATSLLRTKLGQVDYNLGGLPVSAHAELAGRYGVNRERYFVRPTLNVFYLALNTSRPAFSKVALRKAVNFAIDRPSLARVGGFLCCRRTDQILPPGMPGYRDATIYPIKGADPARARRLANGANDEVVVLYPTGPAALEAYADILRYNLERMGLRPVLNGLPPAVVSKIAGTRGGEFDLVLTGWLADYVDPFNFINVLFDGGEIREEHNLNLSYFDSARYNRLMRAAARLSGDDRYERYGRLDVELTAKAAPIAAIFNGNRREFIGPRITNYIAHPLYATPLNALALK